jgi:hypothetical protein
MFAHAARAGRVHLCELGKIGVAQDQTDVRMCDEAPVCIDNVGFAASPNLNLADTSQMCLRFTSAIATPASRRAPAIARFMNGSDSRAK